MRALALLTSVIVLSAASVVTAQARYELVDVGTLGGVTTRSFDINENGADCGVSWTGNGNMHNAFYYDGNMITLGSLMSSSTSEAHGVNDLGQVVGFAYASGSPYYDEHPFLYSDGNMIDLGTLGGRDGAAWAVNNHSQVVGMSELDYGTYEDHHAFLWTDGNMVDMGTLGGRNSWAFDINDNGQAVGRSLTANAGARQHAFLYEDGNMIDLSVPFGGLQSAAYGINNAADVVGNYNASEGGWRPFLYLNGEFIDPGTFGGTGGTAQDINNLGQAVGSASTADGKSRAFLYEGGILKDLNDLIPEDSGWTLHEAYAINDDGWIVGFGSDPQGDTHGFLLVPEPATLAIDIDIRPGSDVNQVNLKSKGVLPVTIFGTEELDVSLIDLATLILDGATPRMKGKSGNIGSFVDVDGDSILDLMLHFDIEELSIDPEADELVLTGALVDGTELEGRDSIRIVPH